LPHCARRVPRRRPALPGRQQGARRHAQGRLLPRQARRRRGRQGRPHAGGADLSQDRCRPARREASRRDRAKGPAMNKLVFLVAALAAPAAGLAQNPAPPPPSTTLTVQPIYSAPTTAPLTLDPSGTTTVPLGNGPNPYLPSQGGGPTYLPATSPGFQPEG